MADFTIRLDLREVAVEKFDEAVANAGNHTGFLMTAWQWTAWNRDGHADNISSRTIVMVPDFLYYARLGSTGQAREIIKLPGSITKVFLSGLSNFTTNLRNVPGLASGDFWSAAETLTAYDMGLLPGSFSGEVILQYNLADFTWLFGRQTFMESFVKLASKASSWGVATQQLSKALSSCARWNLSPGRILYTTGVNRADGDLLAIARAECFKETKFTVDLTQWPKELICNDDIGNLRQKHDSEWLLNYDNGMCFLKEVLQLTS